MEQCLNERGTRETFGFHRAVSRVGGPLELGRRAVCIGAIIMDLPESHWPGHTYSGLLVKMNEYTIAGHIRYDLPALSGFLLHCYYCIGSCLGGS